MSTPDPLLSAPAPDSRPLTLLTEAALPAWLAQAAAPEAAWARAHGFAAERHRVLSLPGAEGGIAGVLAGLGPLGSADELKLWHVAGLPERLPLGAYHLGAYHLAAPLSPQAATQLSLGWLTGSYRFTRYRSAKSQDAPSLAQLCAPKGADLDYACAAARAAALARDLINTPAMDMGPAQLAEAAVSLGARHGAQVQVVSGTELAQGFPLIAAVGAASPRAPRLIDLSWGDPDAPQVTLVGKGVVFDTGGLDLKPSAAMLLMKKDMGGAACALALAQMLMQLQAPIRLRVLIPAVENSIGGAAYRPGDVLRSRKGLTVEVGNTDAEGRLVLADALTLADNDLADNDLADSEGADNDLAGSERAGSKPRGQPGLLVSLATLTGAARVALGPELPAAYARDEALLGQLRQRGEEEGDPVWPMPLWAPYDEELNSKLADLGNVSSGSFAGSIIAALFLQRFVSRTPAFLHLDLYAWNPRERPGRPVGAEAQCVRGLYRLIRSRYG